MDFLSRSVSYSKDDTVYKKLTSDYVKVEKIRREGDSCSRT